MAWHGIAIAVDGGIQGDHLLLKVGSSSVTYICHFVCAEQISLKTRDNDEPTIRCS